MAHVDFLPRNPRQPKMQTSAESKRILLAEITDNWLVAEQQKDPETFLIISKIENNELGETLATSYEIRSKKLFRKIQRNGKTRCLPVVPRSFRWSIVNYVHERNRTSWVGKDFGQNVFILLV